MSTFEIRGGKSLKGEVTPQGAKNEALQVLCATLLTDEPVRIKNLPDIRDVSEFVLVDVWRVGGQITWRVVGVSGQNIK